MDIGPIIGIFMIIFEIRTAILEKIMNEIKIVLISLISFLKRV